MSEARSREADRSFPLSSDGGRIETRTRYRSHRRRYVSPCLRMGGGLKPHGIRAACRGKGFPLSSDGGRIETSYRYDPPRCAIRRFPLSSDGGRIETWSEPAFALASRTTRRAKCVTRLPRI